MRDSGSAQQSVQNLRGCPVVHGLPELANMRTDDGAIDRAPGNSYSATCLDRRWEPGDLGSSGAERGGLARESAAVPFGVFWLTNGSAACPAHPVRLWLK